jgi:hypothetical protein
MITFTDYYSQEYFHLLGENEKKKWEQRQSQRFKLERDIVLGSVLIFEYLINVMLLQKHQWTNFRLLLFKRIPVSFESVSVGKCTGHVCPVSSNICQSNCKIYRSMTGTYFEACSTISQADRGQKMNKNSPYRGTITFCLHLVSLQLVSTFPYVGCTTCRLLPTHFSSIFLLINSYIVKNVKFHVPDL